MPTVSKTSTISAPKFKYQRFPFATMAVGDSFAVRYTDKETEIKARQEICSALFQHQRRRKTPEVLHKTFTIRKHNGREIRCWRVS